MALLVQAIQDGRFLRVLFLAMLGLSVGTVGYDFQQLVANAPGALPGSQRQEPAPFELPTPGDQTRPYLPRTIPLSPDRGKPNLPGYFGPIDGSEIAQEMTFHKGPDGQISAVGTITPGTIKRLQSFLADNEKQIGMLFLHSPGGSVSDAIAMARMVRRAGISTRVPANGYCASSCPLILAGGLHRTSGRNAWIGVHQVYALPPAVGSLQRGMQDAQSASALCQKLLVDMEVDPRVWIYAMQTPPAQLYIFTADELTRLKLANHARKLSRPMPRPLESNS